MPRGLLVACLLAGATAAGATTYTVAPSGGDFTRIQAALDVAVAGDTVVVRQGATPYFEKLVFPRSGDAAGGWMRPRRSRASAPSSTAPGWRART